MRENQILQIIPADGTWYAHYVDNDGKFKVSHPIVCWALVEWSPIQTDPRLTREVVGLVNEWWKIVLVYELNGYVVDGVTIGFACYSQSPEGGTTSEER